jgi:hypothetical protein
MWRIRGATSEAHSAGADLLQKWLMAGFDCSGEVGRSDELRAARRQAMDSLSRGEAARRSKAANEIASAQVHATLALAEAMCEVASATAGKQ